MKLHSNILGEGKPMLILHGFLGMSDNWKSLGKKYAEEGFEVHLIDQRNHGKSPHSDAFSYEHLSNDLLAYMNEKEINQCILLGHSMGGKTAMHFTAKHPEYVEKLILADITPRYYPPHHQDILAGLNALDFSKIKSRKEADLTLSEYVKESGIRMFLLKNLKRISKDQYELYINLKTLTEKIDEIGQGLFPEAHCTPPTLIVRGTAANYVLDSDIPLLNKHFANYIIRDIEKAGHWLHAENPSLFLAHTLKFIK